MGIGITVGTGKLSAITIDTNLVMGAHSITLGAGQTVDGKDVGSALMDKSDYDSNEDSVAHGLQVNATQSEVQRKIVQETETYNVVNHDTGETNLGAAIPAIPSGYEGATNQFRLKYKIKRTESTADGNPQVGLFKGAALQGSKDSIDFATYTDYIEITKNVTGVSAGEVFQVKANGTGGSGYCWVYIIDFEIFADHNALPIDLTF